MVGTGSRRAYQSGMLELCFVGNEERHVEVYILQGILRQHNGNELEGPKPAVGDDLQIVIAIFKRKI